MRGHRKCPFLLYTLPVEPFDGDVDPGIVNTEPSLSSPSRPRAKLFPLYFRNGFPDLPATVYSYAPAAVTCVWLRAADLPAYATAV